MTERCQWRRWTALVVGLVTALAIAGCGGDDNEAADNNAAGDEPSSYKIGIGAPLTGDEAEFGEQMKQAFDLAATSIGEIDGVPLELVYEDTQAVPRQGVTAMRKLVSVDKVEAAITFYSEVVLASAEVANQNEVALVNPAAQATSLSGASEFLFTNIPLADLEVRALARYAYEEAGLREVAIIYINDDRGSFTSEVFQKEFESLGGKIVAKEAHEQGATNFRPQLTKLAGANPDGLFLASFFTEPPFIMRQARDQGMDIPFLGTGVFDSEGVLKLPPDVVDGAVFSAPAFSSDCEEPECREFVDAYRAEHDSDPNQFQAHGWDAVHILAEAIAKGGYDGVAIRDAIRDIGTFQGAAGETTFLDDGTSVKPVAVKRIEGGAAETIDTVEP